MNVCQRVSFPDATIEYYDQQYKYSNVSEAQKPFHNTILITMAEAINLMDTLVSEFCNGYRNRNASSVDLTSLLLEINAINGSKTIEQRSEDFINVSG